MGAGYGATASPLDGVGSVECRGGSDDVAVSRALDNCFKER